MKRLLRILSEPFAQFLVIGAVVAGLYSMVGRSPPIAGDTIVEVGPGRIAQLSETFQRAWQRPPTPLEMDGLIAAFVKEEIFYREGRKIGLDRDDTVFRRRIQQKMEFLIEPSEAEMTPDEADLQAYLDANAQAYRVPATLAFRQLFFDVSRRGLAAEADALAALAALNANDAAAGPGDIGDATLLPPAMSLTRIDRIESDFGAAFATGLEQAAIGRWSGPVRSTYGLHLVMVDQRTAPHVPPLEEVRAAVLRDWQDRKRREIAEDRYRRLRAGYQVIVDVPDPTKISEISSAEQPR
ncbi:peptidylprolyl isomerase [Ensifer sp. MJa1]|uniref:peptidylprolyl isomerase n=1 Tax=Ensifer sp. MJa1 TaxID=2919888 RepID=UPI00300987B2